MSFFSSSTASSASSSRRNNGGYTGLRLNSDLDHLQSSYRPYHDEPGSEEDEDAESGPPPPMMGYQSGGGPWPLPPTLHHGGGGGDGGTGVVGGGGGNSAADPSDVFIHTVSDSSKSRWSHIDDLDSFFKKVYNYHQKHGFQVMMMRVSK
jgi:hypothetical protein